MNADINRRARFSGFGMYHLAVALLLGVAIGISLTLGILLSAPANAEGTNAITVVAYNDAGQVLEVNHHNVVTTSTLPHCAAEDGGPVTPCTWNVGSTNDGNGAGLAYVVTDHRGIDDSFTYVWATSPAVNGWRWVRGTVDCVAKSGKARVRCADGNYHR